MFNQYTFCGASVHSVQSNIGWNSESSKLIVNVFEDVSNGDSLTLREGDEGTPVYFSLSGFKFNGLIEKFERTNNPQVNPGYTIQCSDPRILLSNTKLILRNYTGVSNLVNNLLNIYGYLEYTGFGNSLVNDVGMPWYLIRDTIEDITSAVAGNFGGPIKMKHFNYSVNLSALPTLPDYFRIGGEDGSNLSILDFIEICCQAAGCDYFIELSGYEIKVRTASRTAQLPTGVLNAWVDSFYGNSLVSKTVGYELRNDVNANFVVGGKVSHLLKASGYSTFWGFDNNNEAILGSGAYFKFRRTALDYSIGNNGLGWVQTDKFTLWLPQLADILGTPYYECSDFELRLVLGKKGNAEYSNWLSYIERFRPSIHSLLYNYTGTNNISNTPLFSNPTPDAIVNDRPGSSGAIMHIQAMANAAGVMNNLYNVKRVFGELKIVAETFLNRMYAVRVPNLSSYAEPETNIVKYSYDIANEGYIGNSGENDLNGLPPLYYGKFQTPEGLFNPFVFYRNAASGYDTESINPISSLTNNSGVYDKCTFINKFAVKNNTPYAIANVNPITNPPDSFWGADDDITIMLNAGFVETVSTKPSGGFRIINPSGSDLTVADGQKRLAFGSLGFGIAPRAYQPTNFHVALQSNIARYGPWYARSVSGSHTNYEQRDDFVPWSFGGYDVLNLMASGYVANNATNQQSLVSANVVVAELPNYSLGDVIGAIGPNLTRVSIQYGTQGVQTTYNIETFVSRPGTITKYNMDRLRRGATLSKKAANNISKQIIKNNILTDQLNAGRGQRGFIDLLPRALRGETPHYSIVGRIENWTSGTTLAGVCFATLEEGLIAANINSGTEFAKGAMVSLDAIFHPYSYGGSSTSAVSGMPQQRLLTGVWTDKTILNGDTNHIFREGKNNIRVLAYNSGDNKDYVGAHAYYNNFYDRFPVSGTPRRSMSLRAPLILTGWGRNVDTTVTWGSGDTFNPDFMTNAGSWKTGPMDMLWDENRQCWTSFGKHKGTAVTSIPAGGSGFINIKKSQNRNTQTTNDLDTGMRILTWNWFNTAISSGTKVFIDYVADDNKYYITSANC